MVTHPDSEAPSRRAVWAGVTVTAVMVVVAGMVGAAMLTGLL